MLKSNLCWIILLSCTRKITCGGTILKEKKPTENEWWKNTILYQVYPRSFQDSNNDGIGDLKGIIQRLDHFVDLGIETLWIGPIYKSPMIDMGYDVDNFTDIDPMFGTMDDLNKLITEMNKRNIKFITDFIPNHTSNNSEWFQKSIKRMDKYADYYVWRDAKNQAEINKNSSVTPLVPNNWLSIFGYTSWTWNAERKQFYFHQFTPQQPDLNLRNKFVKNELLNVLKFWLDKGVSGFRIDAVPRLYENQTYVDEPNFKGKEGSTNYRDIDHIYTKDQPEVIDILIEWRQFIDLYTKTQNYSYPRIMVLESYSPLNIQKQYFGNNTHPAAHFSFNMGFVTSINRNNIIDSMDQLIYKWIEITPQNSVANWVMENHDNPRLSKKFGLDMIPLFNTLKLALPGVEVTYYGGEIGMDNILLRTDQIIDPILGDYRDCGRTPMQWNTSINAGFTQKSKPWLPVNPNYYKLNVETQKRIPTSNYNLYKKMSQLRKTNTLKFGSLQTYNISQSIYIIKRSLSGHESYLVVLNFGSETESLFLSNVIYNLKDKLYVYLGSENSYYRSGDIVSTNTLAANALKLPPQSVVVLTDKEIKPESMLSTGYRIDSKLVILLCSFLFSRYLLKLYIS